MSVDELSYRSHDLFLEIYALTITLQERLARSPAACLMATGLVRCRRFQSTAPSSWTKMLSHIQVSLDTFGQQTDFLILTSLESRLVEHVVIG